MAPGPSRACQSTPKQLRCRRLRQAAACGASQGLLSRRGCGRMVCLQRRPGVRAPAPLAAGDTLRCMRVHSCVRIYLCLNAVAKLRG